MHNFVYLAQRRSEEFSCEPNFGGRAPAPPPWLRQWSVFVTSEVFCRNVLKDRAGFRMKTSFLRPILHCVVKKFSYLQK